MKDKKIFDILENAENDTMKRLIDKCPEISDEQLDRIFVMSEKKFRSRKNSIDEAERDERIKMTEGDVVEGVEHSRRPAWFAPVSAAASMILVAGIAVGSVLMLRNRGPEIVGNVNNPPAVTVTTTVVSGTSVTVTDNDGSGTATSFAAVSGTGDKTTTTTTEAVTDPAKEEAADTEFIKPYVGRWRYQTSPNNTVHIDGVDTGTVDIYEDATYTYTDKNGNVSTGTVKKAVEEIGGTELFGLDFSGNSFIGHRAIYVESAPDELHFGNGDAARIVRGTANKTYSETAAEKMDNFDRIEGLMAVEHHSSELSFSENGVDYYRYTGSEFGSLAEIRALIEDTMTGDLRDEYMGECESRYKERDGVIYQSRGQRGTFSFDTSGGVVISEVNDSRFTATAVNANFVPAQGRGSAVFKKENGEWKMSGYSAGEPMG